MALANNFTVIDPSISRIYLLDSSELYLVPFQKLSEDINVKALYLSWLNDIENLKSIGSDALLSPNKDDQFIESSFKRFTSYNSVGFFIYYKMADAFIGTCKLDSFDPSLKSATDGILIGDKNWQGKGLATIIYKTLLMFGFTYLSLHLVNGGCNAQNLAMLRVFKRIGYKHQKTIINADCIDGLVSNHEYFSITQTHFLQKYRYEKLQIISAKTN
tara:strand:+ start:1562 stop:2209 length:648 start_codon:yes stop_codon:yes gene_type:complete